MSVLALGLFGGLMLAPGAASAKTVTHKATINVVVIGDPFSYGDANSTDATLRNGPPPTLQALNAVQAADKNLQLRTLFIPVAETATPTLLGTSPSSAGKPSGSGTHDSGSPSGSAAAAVSSAASDQALISAVHGAGVVLTGLAGGNASLAAPVRSVLFGTSAAPKALAQVTTAVGNGTFLDNETTLLNQIGTHASPGSSIVVLGYPMLQPEHSGKFFSPYTLSEVGSRQANESALLAAALNTASKQAMAAAAARNPSLVFSFANLSAAPPSAKTSGSKHRSSSSSGNTPSGGTSSGHSSSGHPSSGGAAPASPQPDVNLISNSLLPIVDHAVNNQLASQGFQGTPDVPQVTPPKGKSTWTLPVLLPAPGSVMSTAQPPNTTVNNPPPLVPPPAHHHGDSDQPPPVPHAPHDHGHSGSGNGDTGSGNGDTGSGNGDTGSGNGDGGSGSSGSPAGDHHGHDSGSSPHPTPTSDQPNPSPTSGSATAPPEQSASPVPQPGSSPASGPGTSSTADPDATPSAGTGPGGRSPQPTCPPGLICPGLPATPAATPTPDPTAQPGATPTPQPTATAAPLPTVSATPSPQPTGDPGISPATVPPCEQGALFFIDGHWELGPNPEWGCLFTQPPPSVPDGPITPIVPAPPAPIPDPIAPAQAPPGPATEPSGTPPVTVTPTTSTPAPAWGPAPAAAPPPAAVPPTASTTEPAPPPALPGTGTTSTSRSPGAFT